MKAYASIAALVLLGGCASLPEVEYTYYLAKSQTAVSVSETLDCTVDKMSLIIVNTPTVNTVYSADPSKGSQHVKIADAEGFFAPFADSDMSFTFYDDGRLKSINTSTTGEGETVIKSAVALATALGGGAKAAPAGQPLAVCDKIKNWGNGKPATILYNGTFDLSQKLGTTTPLQPAASSQKIWTDLKEDPNVPVIALQVTNASATDNGAKYVGASTDYVPLTLQDTANVRVDVTASGQSIWTGTVAVPLAKTYVLPILKAALFGKQSFSLALTEAGAITTVDYGKNSGATGALNAAGAVASAEAPETPAAQAADLKAQADLIAQQQRLARCRASPSTCQ